MDSNPVNGSNAATDMDRIRNCRAFRSDIKRISFLKDEVYLLDAKTIWGVAATREKVVYLPIQALFTPHERVRGRIDWLYCEPAVH
jgi:hypothetical protein